MRGATAANNYRWVILTVATVGLVISNGLAIGGIPVFYTPIRAELTANKIIPEHAAQGFIATGAIITFLMSGIFSFVGGWALSRIGIRRSMIFGSIVLGLSFLLHSQAESIWLIYVCRFLMGASLGFVGVTPSVILVSNWFGKRKGMALGVLLTGTSIGGFIMPLVFAKLIEHYQWRPAMLIISFFVWFILLPLVVFFVKDPIHRRDAEPNQPMEGMTLNEALRTPQFWIFSAAAAMIFYTIFVTTQQFILYLQSPAIGLSLAIASAWQSILFALSVTGKSAAGLLSDRFTASRITVFSTAMMFVSTLLLLLLGAPFIFLIIYGLGYGATFVMLQRIVADYFGRRDYGRILGAITMIEIFGGAIGGRVTGYLADRSGGDYRTAFYAMIGITGAAFICMLVLILLGTKSKESAAS